MALAKVGLKRAGEILVLPGEAEVHSKVDEARPGPWPKGSGARSLSEAPAGPIGSAYCAARLSRPDIRRVPLSGAVGTFYRVRVGP